MSFRGAITSVPCGMGRIGWAMHSCTPCVRVVRPFVAFRLESSNHGDHFGATSTQRFGASVAVLLLSPCQKSDSENQKCRNSSWRRKQTTTSRCTNCGLMICEFVHCGSRRSCPWLTGQSNVAYATMGQTTTGPPIFWNAAIFMVLRSVALCVQELNIGNLHSGIVAENRARGLALCWETQPHAQNAVRSGFARRSKNPCPPKPTCNSWMNVIASDEWTHCNSAWKPMKPRMNVFHRHKHKHRHSHNHSHRHRHRHRQRQRQRQRQRRRQRQRQREMERSRGICSFLHV